MAKQKFVEVGDFATVMDKSHEGYGISMGDVVYVAGDAIVSVSEDDPYQLRRIFICATLKDGHVQAKGAKPFTMDGKRLKPVSKGKQEKLDAIKQQDFGGEGEAQ